MAATAEKNIIADYFNNLSDKLVAESRVAGTTGHRTDTGNNREDLAIDFLNKHLPQSLTAFGGGVVVGLSCAHSAQIDVLVRSASVPRFDQNQKSFIVAEALAAAISVKSELNKQSLLEALGGLATIPALSEEALDMSPSANVQKKQFFDHHPSLFLWAFSGSKMETIKEHIDEYYSQNHSVPQNRRPKEVFVLGKWCLSRRPSESKTTAGEMIPANTWNTTDLLPT